MRCFRFVRWCGLILGFLAFIAGQARAQVRTPKYSNEFLNIGVGGRALGMGNVQAALAEGTTAGYWNPAGLLELKHKNNVALMHSELFAGIVKNDYASFAMPLDTVSAFGLSLIRTGVDDIADTRNLVNEYGYINYDNIRLFSVADYALLVSYARKSTLLKGLRLGGNVKLIYRNVGSFAQAYGFGLDAGAQFKRKNWRFGLMGRDISTTFNAWVHDPEAFRQTAAVSGDSLLIKSSVEITLPRLVAGVARHFRLSDQLGALLAADLDLTFDGKRNVLLGTRLVSADPHLGLELHYEQVVYLRLGLNNLQQIRHFDQRYSWRLQPNFGLGISVGGLELDLALSRLADTTPANNFSANSKLASVIVSLAYSFD